jgi:hypothetical protein
MNQGTGEPPSNEAEQKTEQPQSLPTNSLKTIESATPQPKSTNGKKQCSDKTKTSWPVRVEAGCAVILVVITGFYTHYAALQWSANEKAANAAACAANIAAQALKDSQDSFAKTLEQMKRQTTAQQKAAVATEKSNETAMASLHISERAYISMNPPQIDTVQHPIAITFPLTNGGHIPSGDIEVVCHQATFESNAPMLSWNPGLNIDHGWHRFRLPAIPPGSPFSISIVLKFALKEKLESVLQALLVAGKITYRDGFADDPLQEWPFCTQTTYAMVSKKMILSPCDASKVAPFLEHLDGYPNNESQD